MTPRTLVDVATAPMRLSQMLDLVERFSAAHPGLEVWMDGETYSIVYAPRRASA